MADIYVMRCVKIGKRIREERKRSKLTQNLLAEKLSDMMIESAKDNEVYISQNTISDWEKGKRLPPLYRMVSLSLIFDCDIGYLLCDYDERKRNLADVREQTGLSAAAAERLCKIHEKGVYGVTINGYTPNMVDVLSELITSSRFFPLMNAISFFLAYGGLLPVESHEVEALSPEEYSRFFSWANERGLVIKKKSDVCEMYLQTAADELKNMYREILQAKLKKTTPEQGR